MTVARIRISTAPTSSWQDPGRELGDHNGFVPYQSHRSVLSARLHRRLQAGVEIHGQLTCAGGYLEGPLHPPAVGEGGGRGRIEAVLIEDRQVVRVHPERHRGRQRLAVEAGQVHAERRGQTRAGDGGVAHLEPIATSLRGDGGRRDSQETGQGGQDQDSDQTQNQGMEDPVRTAPALVLLGNGRDRRRHPDSLPRGRPPQSAMFTATRSGYGRAMTKYGMTLSSEEHPPQKLVDLAVA